MLMAFSGHRTRGCQGVPDLCVSGLCEAPTQTVTCSAWEQIPAFALFKPSVFLLHCTEQFITYQETLWLMLTRRAYSKELA